MKSICGAFVLTMALCALVLAAAGQPADDKAGKAAVQSTDVKAGKPQTTCPVTGDKLENKNVYSDYKGKRVYFCCTGCANEFSKDPEKYMKQMKDAGVTPEDTPKPVKPAAAK